MRISWITKLLIMPTVVYGTVSGKYENSANGTSSSYHYLRIYQSGQINDVVIGPLKPNTVYYYKCGGTYSTQEFNFKTPPSQFPINFAVAGTLHIPFFLIRSYTKRSSFHKIMLCSSIRFFLLMFLKTDKKKWRWPWNNWMDSINAGPFIEMGTWRFCLAWRSVIRWFFSTCVGHIWSLGAATC